MLARQTFDWGSKSWAMVLVVLMHLVFLALLLSTRTLKLPGPARAVEVKFFSDTQAPATVWQAPDLPLTLKVETPLVVPAPEVAVVSVPTAINAVTAQATSPPSTPISRASPGPQLMSDVEYVKQPMSRYPLASKRLREQGTVVLRVLVDEQGFASRVDVYQSSGFPRLDAAACEAVRHALFKPYVYAGRTQAALVLVPIEFSLKA